MNQKIGRTAGCGETMKTDLDEERQRLQIRAAVEHGQHGEVRGTCPNETASDEHDP